MYIIRPWLYTGRYQETQDLTLFEQGEIDAMLQLFRPVEQPDITSLYLRVEDGYPIADDVFAEALAFVKAQHEAEKRVFIACGAGVSRSSSFAVASLVHIEGLGLRDAFWQVRAGNPRAMPDQVHWASLARYFNEDVSFWDLWRDAEM